MSKDQVMLGADRKVCSLMKVSAQSGITHIINKHPQINSLTVHIGPSKSKINFVGTPFHHVAQLIYSSNSTCVEL